MCHSALYILFATAAFSQALRCRVDYDTKSQEEFEDLVRMCIRNVNEFQENNQEHGNRGNRGDRNKGTNQFYFQSSQGKKQTAENYENEYETYDYDGDNSKNNKNKNQQSGMSNQNNRYQNNNQRQNNNQNQGYKNSNNQGSNYNSRKLGTALDSVEPCIIHCIFKHKKMLNKQNYIDKSNTIQVLTQRVRNQNLREFIEDSVNECFDELNNYNSEGKCEDSKNFALCLEEKGKETCEDWDPSSRNKSGNKGNFNPYKDNNYYINNNRGQYYDRNSDKSTEGSHNRDQQRQNRFSNNKPNSFNRKNYNHSNQESNNGRSKNNYSDESSEERGKNKQNDDGEESKKWFQSYFQERG